MDVERPGLLRIQPLGRLERHTAVDRILLADCLATLGTTCDELALEVNFVRVLLLLAFLALSSRDQLVELGSV